MKILLRWLTSASLVILFHNPSAWAGYGDGVDGFKLSPTLGMLFADFSQKIEITSATPTITGITADADYAPGFSYILGGLAEYRWNRWFGFESGLLFGRRKFTLGATSSTVTGLSFVGASDSSSVSANYLEIPLLPRFYPLPFLSAGFGPYIAFGMGNVSVSQVSGGTSSNSSVSFSDAGIDRTDLGLMLSGKALYGLKEAMSAFIDIRYYFGIKNVAEDEQITTGALQLDHSAHHSGFEILLGLRFGEDGLRGFQFHSPHQMESDGDTAFEPKPTSDEGDRPKKKRRLRPRPQF